ncbi:uncharacterized protein LOC121971027 [Zingiber officinale]|uniref:Uncharacterized protein n=1 Tax=Zingiber officinale TaxID=94328 RepID=A0A8J5H227_ZINOF|nr:uncharacterized protein LOC121971027 [Zingiber officinale]KAG6515486.1 hypothetical protein ZIOFF_025900 [Zingiber officinale]
MMLKSSSTPILGSLHLSGDGLSAQHLHPVACQFSPASDGIQDPPLGIRRTRSDGNVLSILSDEEHRPPPKCSSSSSRRSSSFLEPIPSLSLYKTDAVAEEEEQEGEDGGANREASDTVGSLRSIDSGSAALPPLFLARGLGIDRVGSDLFAAVDCGICGDFGGCGGGNCDVLTGSGGEQSDAETYYKKMVEENPSDALFLRNYAEFLYQTKRDLRRAEEYYSRAILAAPGDGEILSQYAKIVWELHHDGERASIYFQQAVQASPQDSHVLAAYAGFLWETEEAEEEDGDLQDFFMKSSRDGALPPVIV